MDYEQKYKEALERCEQYRQYPVNWETCVTIFPELKESEDEKIRKALIEVCNRSLPAIWETYNCKKDEVLVWLEKQENKNSLNHQDINHSNGCIVTEDFNDGEGFYKLCLDYLDKKQVAEIEAMVKKWNQDECNQDEKLKSCIGMILTDGDEQRFKDYGTNLRECLNWLEKQGEPVETPKPKFKVGDWIVHTEIGTKYLIKDIEGAMYIVKEEDGSTSNNSIDIVDKFSHLWTIQDAKPGDVLSNKNTVCIFKKMKLYHYDLFDSYCELLDGIYFGLGFDFNVYEFYPATKEQRDLLFQKMEEKGYEWDKEKLELKKIEQNIDESQSVDNKEWSNKYTYKLATPKIDDWVIDANDQVHQVILVDIDEEGFTLDDHTYVSGSWINDYRLWTIQDAKPGDVLKEDSCIFLLRETKSKDAAVVWCVLFDDGEFTDGSTLHFDAKSTHPATKEQRDLLFQKMKEEGYKWDAEKLKLKKINN